MVAVSTAAPSTGAAGKILENGYYGASAHLGASTNVEYNYIDHAVVDRPALVCELGAAAPAGWVANTLAVASISMRIHISPSGAFSFSGTVRATDDIGSDGETTLIEPTTIILSGHIVTGTHITGETLAAYETVHARICPVGTRVSFRLAWE